MSERPKLGRELDSALFREHYYLKEELVQFCRENGLPVSGGKLELTERIACFLETGKAAQPERKNPRKRGGAPVVLTKDSMIEENIVCSEKHRAFFREHIGKGFSFNVAFQKWLKSNAGKTYGDAIEAYNEIKAAGKNSKKVIDKQFEYNTYIRDFFADNKGRSLEEAIVCWKYKKSIPEHNRYEPSDLAALEE